MAKYVCSGCGAEALEGSKFCKICGKSIIQVKPSNLGGLKNKEEKIKVKKIKNEKEKDNKTGEIIKGANMLKTVEHKYRATKGRGSMVFSQDMNLGGSLPFQESSSFLYAFGRFKGIFSGFKSLLKSPRTIITLLVLIISWVGLLLVEVSEDQTPMTEVLSYLTFAKGGFKTNSLGMIGGTFGKAILAGAAISLVNGIFSGKLFKNFGASIKGYFSAFRVNGFNGIVLLAWGVGLGLIGYNFFTGNLSAEYSMIGIVSIMVVIRSISTGSGFIYGLLASIMTKTKKKNGKKYISRFPNPSVIKNGLAGITVGTAFGLAISGAGNEAAGYMIGLIILGVALILSIVAVGMGGRQGA